MIVNRRLLLLSSLAFAGLAPLSSRAGETGSWDGVWTGKLDNSTAIAIHIANNKAVDYELMGTPIGIKFSDASANSISFGDPDHYSFRLTRTGDGAAIGVYHGRRGISKAALSRS